MDNYHVFKEYHNSTDFINDMMKCIRKANESKSIYIPIVFRSKDGKCDVVIDECITEGGDPVAVHVYRLVFNDIGTHMDIDLVIELDNLYKDYYLLVDDIEVVS